DEVSINALALGRTDIPQESSEYTLESASNEPERKKNKLNLDTLTNATLENILKRGTSVNITATRKINVTSAINLSNGSLTLHTERGGIELNGDITSDNNKAGANLTIKSGGWLDIHSNISLGERDNINITAKGDIAFEKGNNQIIKGRGVITSGDQNGFRFDNVSLNGVGTGLLFNTKRSKNGNGNISNHFRGTLNISGIVNISMAAPNTSWIRRVYGRTYWNLTSLNVAENSKFNLTIDNRGSGTAGTLNRRSNLNGITFNGDTTFNVSSSSMVNFDIKASIIVPRSFDVNYALFNGNVSVLGGGRVAFNLDASSNSFETSGVTIKSHFFNVSGGSTLNLSTNGSTKTAFSIENDLTLNATGSSITLKQIEGTDSRIGNGVVANKNITFNGGNITLGSQKAPTQIKGNVTINANTNATLRGANFNNNKSALNITGNVINNGNLTTDGSIINIGGSLTVAESAKLQAVTNFTFNVAGLFDNKGNSNISIAKGGAKFKDINNTKNLSIATNSSAAYRTIIAGNITNKSGDL
ncbi:TPA: adhesin, partial [Haemophilus influenzae]